MSALPGKMASRATGGREGEKRKEKQKKKEKGTLLSSVVGIQKGSAARQRWLTTVEFNGHCLCDDSVNKLHAFLLKAQ